MVPQTGERVPLAGVRCFATVNPVSVGGGRSQLPRSLASCFTHVQLAAPTAPELEDITAAVFAGCVEQGLLRAEHVRAVFAAHRDVCEELAARRLVGTGGPTAFNLRDIIKARRAEWGTAATRLREAALLKAW